MKDELKAENKGYNDELEVTEEQRIIAAKKKEEEEKQVKTLDDYYATLGTTVSEVNR